MVKVPRYYFHMLGGSDEYSDESGAEYRDVPTAISECITVVRQMVADAVLEGDDLNIEQRIEIFDENNSLVATIPFKIALTGLH
jgi:hypothetical protein